MPVLESYVESGFKTLEDKRFEQNFRIAIKSLRVSNKTFIISIVACAVSIGAALMSAIFGYKQLHSPSHIEDEQLQHMETIIEQSNEMHPPIEVTTLDTLKVQVLNNPQKR